MLNSYGSFKLYLQCGAKRLCNSLNKKAEEEELSKDFGGLTAKRSERIRQKMLLKFIAAFWQSESQTLCDSRQKCVELDFNR